MAESLAPSGTSAQIIPLPGAAGAPVKQRGTGGRHPKSVTSIWIYKRDKRWAATAQAEEAKLRSQVDFAERILRQSRIDLLVFTQSGQGSRAHV